MLAPDQLIVGRHYRIRYTLTERSNAKVLESVLRFIGLDRERNELLFSGRPQIGTQSLSYRRLTEIEQVADDAKIYNNWDPRSRHKPKGWTYAR